MSSPTRTDTDNVDDKLWRESEGFLLRKIFRHIDEVAHEACTEAKKVAGEKLITYMAALQRKEMESILCKLYVEIDASSRALAIKAKAAAKDQLDLQAAFIELTVGPMPADFNVAILEAAAADESGSRKETIELMKVQKEKLKRLEEESRDCVKWGRDDAQKAECQEVANKMRRCRLLLDKVVKVIEDGIVDSEVPLDKKK